MPHVIVKVQPGKSEQQKKAVAEAIARSVTDCLDAPDATISIAIEEVEVARWKDDVYLPQIKPDLDKLYKKPGYDM